VKEPLKALVGFTAQMGAKAGWASFERARAGSEECCVVRRFATLRARPVETRPWRNLFVYHRFSTRRAI